MGNLNKILKKFSNLKKLRFSELDKDMSSNQLSYYLNKLISSGLLIKKGEFYYISEKGEKHLCYLDDSTQIEQPIHDVFLLPKKGNKYIIQKRTKRPFLGAIIPIGARIREGESIFATAKKKLKEDTGLSGKLQYKGIVDVKTFKEGKFYLHHILNVFLITHLKGNLIEKNQQRREFLAY
ncbi:MAG: NUDIX domain-containing protein [Candidatus Nanoarchaeia archaeon]